ncbi:MAG: beta-phosphoglucomutase [Bacteroidales bacterium]|nr:beta-phosphoglucomutase [Bacteroidales bacterium]MDT8373425.1 beta-phosphoglucomutase [Bacteroidales bacterium]
MDLRGCIFDLDGVIVDTAKYHFMAWRRLAKELGFEFTIEDNEALKGVSRMTSLEILLRTGGVTVSEKEKEVLAARKNGWYVEFISGMTPDEILPGSVRLLKSLRKAGILTAIGSASRNAGTILDRIALRDMFDAIVDGNKIHNAKPDPEVFLRGAEEMNLPPSCCIVFEDAQAGIEASIAGGMKSVGVGSPELLGRADLVIPNLKNITIRQLRNL